MLVLGYVGAGITGDACTGLADTKRGPCMPWMGPLLAEQTPGLLSRLLIARITAAAFIIGWSITGGPYALLGVLTGVLTNCPVHGYRGVAVSAACKVSGRRFFRRGSAAWWDIALWPSVLCSRGLC
jgi:hypothetical protein